jgi:hydroxyacylglutathione hydrolase
MRIIASRVPPYDNGMYLLVDDRKDCVLIDPSMGERQALAVVKSEGLKLMEILNTHGHPDHIAGNAAVKEATRARLAIHEKDAYRLTDRRPPSTLLVPHADAEDLFTEGPLGFVADLHLVALHTPGHTEGSTCFYNERDAVLFSGDLLFKGSCGRWDLPGGDLVEMQKSLARVMTLPASTKVYPGHGEPTTLADERPNLEHMKNAGILPGLAM